MKYVMFCGLPGLGKSTLANKLYTGDEWTNSVLLSTDNYIENACKNKGITYDEGFRDFFPDAKKHMNLKLKSAIKHRMNIFHDQTNLSRKSRMKKVSEIPDYYEKHIEVFIPIDEEIWKKQLASRPGKTIDDKLIGIMKSQFQMPLFDEGWKSIRLWRV